MTNAKKNAKTEVLKPYKYENKLRHRLGGCAASKRGMESLLKIKKGIATVLVPGGARESLNGEKDEIKLVFLLHYLLVFSFHC